MMKSGFTIRIFTEGSEKIGFGHLSRCSALYDEAERQGFPVELFIQENDCDYTGNCILENRNYSIVNWQSVEYLQNNLDKNDYCIIDSYLATIEVYDNFSQCSARALYIDDYGRLDYPKGIIVNPSLSSEDVYYDRKPDREYLLGQQYIILRSPFIGKKKTNSKKKNNRVLITLGGTDILNLTGEIINSLAPQFPKISFDVVWGKELEDKKEWVHFENASFYCNLTDKEMYELMANSDFAITAAGQTIYELLALGIPFFAIQTAENQCNNIKVLENTLEGTYTSHINEPHLCEKIIQSLHIFGKSAQFNFKDLISLSIDGLGCKRIIETLLSDREKITLKEANMSDFDLLFNWANDETVRMNAFNSKAIEIDEHVLWLDDKISDRSVSFYIAFLNDIPIGQIRVDQKSVDIGEISYSIDKNYRSKGYGKMMMESLIMHYMENDICEINKLTGKVKFDNIASQKVFESIGFKKLKMSDYLLYTYFLNRK